MYTQRNQDWELFRLYRTNIRRHAASKKNDQFLFLNSKGKMISNPSDNLRTILERYGVEVISCNDARHIIETLGKHYLNKEEQLVIHRMLTHTSETAERNYIESNSSAVPHRLGIPLLERLGQQVADEYKIKVPALMKNAQPLIASAVQVSTTSEEALQQASSAS